MVDYRLASLGQFSSFLGDQEVAVLFGQQKPGGNRVHPDVGGIVLQHVNCKPLGKVTNNG